MEKIMNSNIAHLPITPNPQKAISVLLAALKDTLAYPEAALTAAAVVPLFTIILQLIGQLEETVSVLNQRIAICEAGSSRSSI
jgi:hypothetical protein